MRLRAPRGEKRGGGMFELTIQVMRNAGRAARHPQAASDAGTNRETPAFPAFATMRV